MKLETIKSKIYETIKDRFELEDNNNFKDELLSLAHETLHQKEILRIKRFGRKVESWKTLVLIEIEADNENDYKDKLRNAITWLASIKENLLGTENTDLYFFLAINFDVSLEECFRIESTEQFCRKYVLFPGENVSEFINRTFLQKLIDQTDTIEGVDPLERAFAETTKMYNWLTSDTQRKWKNAFSELSGSELAEELLKEDENI